MSIKKIRMRPEGGNDYQTVLHPETSADMVKFSNGGTVEAHKADYTLFKDGAFELWASKSGNTYKTLFDTPLTGDITEEIRNTISNDLVATKRTQFMPNGDINETLHIVEDDITVTATTIFDPNGEIRKVIS